MSDAVWLNAIGDPRGGVSLAAIRMGCRPEFFDNLDG
jgi:hypothetical protein